MKAFDFLKSSLLPVLLAALTFCAVAQHGTIQQTHDSIAAAQVAFAAAGDRVIDLPEDGQAYYLTLFTGDNPSPQDRMLLAWFESDSVLASLKAQTHFNHYTPAVKMYVSRFSAAVPQSEFPAVMRSNPRTRTLNTGCQRLTPMRS